MGGRFLKTPPISEAFQPSLTPEQGRAAQGKPCPCTDVREKRKSGEGGRECPGNQVSTSSILRLLCGFGKNKIKEKYFLKSTFISESVNISSALASSGTGRTGGWGWSSPARAGALASSGDGVGAPGTFAGTKPNPPSRSLPSLAPSFDPSPPTRRGTLTPWRRRRRRRMPVTSR